MKFTTRQSFSDHGFGIDILWLFVVLAGALFFTSLIPLAPNDYWWHLKIGEWIYTHRSIPTTNMFAWTLSPDAPYYYGTWLGELLLYLVHRAGGIQAALFTRTLLFGVTLWLVGVEVKRRSTSWRITAFVIALLVLMAVNNTHIRPQIWSWLPFVIFLSLLDRFKDHLISKKWLLTLPFIMIFWVNSHGAFILGLILIGIYLVGELLALLLKLPQAMDLKDVIWLAITGIMTGLAVLVNPRLFGIVDYVLDLLTDKPSQQLVVEWQSPTPQGFANIAFFISILLVLVCVAYSKYRLSPTMVLTILCFIWLAWSGLRYIIWYSIAVMPVLSQAIANLPLKFPTFLPKRNLWNVLITIILFIPVILVQPWLVERFPLPETYREQVIWDSSIGPLLSTDNPIAAVEYLKSNPGGKLFNEMGYGSYLIWFMPEQGVFIDPRVELYAFEQWQDYIRISNGTDYNRLLDNYGADRILLSRHLQDYLSQILARDPLWQKEYEDHYSQIWIKVGDETH